MHRSKQLVWKLPTITDIDNRDSYLTTGHQIDRGQLGAKEHHAVNYCNLARVYNDESNDQYSSCDVSILQYSDIYDSFSITDNTPSQFDKLDGRSICQIVRFINAKYRVARNNNQKSGTHDDFHNFIGSNPWILFYHERMNELGGDVRSSYMNLAYPSLDNDVFITSDGNTEPPSVLNSNSTSSSTSGSGRKKRRMMML